MSKIKLLSLTPDYDEDNHRVYLDAIEDALTEGDSIKNIALTGGHGVGKSSVLAKLAEAHGNDVVQISLSTLGLSDGDGGGEKSTTNRIQKEIVKQLLYREEPHRMPGSRFRRIARLKFLRSLGTAVLGGFALSLVFFLAGWTTKLEQLFSATALGLWFQFWVFLVLSVTAFGVLVLFHNRIAIKGFKVASADITLTSEETTYFDQFLDEIVYFFDVTKCHIVIFEDIDRFDDPHIFETLRALNTLLNASKQLDGRKIRFVYAIKDSIFEVLGERAAVESGEEATPDVYAEDRGRDEVARANRTKFFDLVIPVVPFITHRNARDLVARVMNDVEPKISGELIELAARHLPEMRLIKNVHNEFLIFRKKVLGAKDGDLNLSPDELFAMMLYKNTSLSDFELVKSGQSQLDLLYADSRKLVRENVNKLTAEAAELMRQLSQLNSVASRSQKFGDKFSEYLDRLGRHLSMPQGATYRVTFKGNPYTSDALFGVDFWQVVADSSDQEAIVVDYAFGGMNPRNLSITKVDLASELGDSLAVSDWEGSDRDAITRKLDSITDNRQFLNHATFKDLYDHSEFETVAGSSFARLVNDRLKSGLAKQLVSTGFIGQNFSLYTSSYYTDSVSARALNFLIHNIDGYVMDIDYQLEPGDVEAIFKERGDSILRERSVYNISILDHLLETNSEKSDSLLQSLKVLGEDEEEFLKAYIASGKHLVKLVEKLTIGWDLTLGFLIDRQDLDEEKKVSLVDVALKNVVASVAYAVDEGFKGFVEKNSAYLGVLRDTATGSDLAKVISSLFSKAGVRLESIGELGVTMREAVLAASCYKITFENLKEVVHSTGLALDEIQAHDQVVYDYAIRNLTEYLAAIRSQGGKFVTVASNNSLSKVLTDVVNNADNLVGEVLDGVDLSAGDIDLGSFPEKAWPALADRDAFSAVPEYVKAYIDSIGVIDEHLGGYLGRVSVFDVGDDLEDADKETLAEQVLAALEVVPDPAIRVGLVVSLKLEQNLAITSVPLEAGPLIGLLIEHEVIEDNAQSFGLTLPHGWATMEVAIIKSKAFVTFMTPTEVPISDVPQLLRSSAVSNSVKDELFGRFEEFIPSDDREALKAAAEYAIATKKKMTFQQLQRVAAADVGQDLAAELLSLALTGLSLEELNQLLEVIGGGLKALISKNGKRPKIKNTAAYLSIVKQLKSFGQVSSFKEKGNDIEVNLKKS
jgi:hypothetical protein